ncbi:MAG: UDP-N-acetylmuramyl-tripeptide synthetase, partial [Acidimicrobiales bacterium]
MHLSELAAIADCDTTSVIGLDPVVSGLAYDSRDVEPGFLFFAISGEVADGHEYAVDAMNSGASALVVERVLNVDLPQLVVPNTRIAMPKMAAEFAGNPSKNLSVVGVTGTNGKTTIVSMLGAIAVAAGDDALVIGTLTGTRTTPESVVLQQRLAAAAAAGVDLVALEVSSHALVQHRVDNIDFAAVVFSNLSTDHLDYHDSMDDYFEAKALLFEPGRSSRSVVWVGDPYGERLAARLGDDSVTRVDDRLAKIEDLSTGGSTFGWRGHRIKLPIGGYFNVSNALLAAEVAVRIGYEEIDIVAGLGALPRIRGRFELVDQGQDFAVIVD